MIWEENYLKSRISEIRSRMEAIEDDEVRFLYEKLLEAYEFLYKLREAVGD